MGMYLNDKPVKPTENPQADEAHKQAVSDWQRDHANDAPRVLEFDAITGKRIGYFKRSEFVVADEPTYKITQFSDGTTRKDNISPPAPKPKPVTVDTKMVHTREDLARLYEGGVTSITTKEGQFTVTMSPEQVPGSKGFSSKRGMSQPVVPREEFGDTFNRP